MIDPATLTHEPTDDEIARRVALLDLPADHPQRRWEPFARYLDRPMALTTGLLQRWLGGRPVAVTDLLTRRQGHRQYRVVSLVTQLDGEPVPLCHATAVVDLRLLPDWACDVLTRTEQPLARTLHRVGAVRERTTATVLDPDPEAPGDAGLRTRGAFRVPAAGGRRVADVEEWFTGYVLRLAEVAEPARPADAWPDDLDRTMVRLLRQRRLLATADRARLRRVAGADTGPDHHLDRQLVHLFRRDRGEPADAAPARDDRAGPVLPTQQTVGDSVDRQGA